MQTKTLSRENASLAEAGRKPPLSGTLPSTLPASNGVTHRPFRGHEPAQDKRLARRLRRQMRRDRVTRQ